MQTQRRLITVQTRALSAALAAALLAVLVACGSSTTGTSTTSSSRTSQTPGAATASGFPVKVTTAAGTTTIAKRPGAIVSLSATATEMLYAIDAASQVKAVDDQSDYPPQAPRTKLSGLQVNVESLVAEKPDLVIIDADRGGLGKRLASLGIPLLVLPAAAKIDDVYAEFAELGTATGHEQAAKDESAKIKSQLDAIVSSVPASKRTGTYYYELEPDFYSVTSDTFVGQLFALIGLHSIADKAAGAQAAGGYPQLSAEYIIKANPDWIFLADTLCCKANAASVGKRPGWSTMTAVAKAHIVPLNDDIASRWGPRIVDLLHSVAAAVAK